MNERCPFAVWRPAPLTKTGYPELGVGYKGPKRGDVKHSAEGGWGGIYSALDSLTRRASWHFTVGYDRIEQHYDLSAHCWHAGDTDDDGGVKANIDLVGIEHLGVAGERLTLDQIDMTTRLSAWCAEQFGRSAFRRFDGWDSDEAEVWLLVEHKEVSNEPTACPSGRIPWDVILAKLQEDDVDDVLRKQIKVAALFRRAATYAEQGEVLPPDLLAAIRFLVG